MKKIIIAIIALVLVAGGVYALFGRSDDPKESAGTSAIPEPTSQNSSTKTVENPDTPVSREVKSEGRYTSYSQSSLAEAGFETNVVFFFAPWCPECRAFKEAINSGNIPEGVQILEADFDSSTDLKKQYGVTLQSTFVRVDDSGELQKKWVGYGRDKSLQNVLNNVQ